VLYFDYIKENTNVCAFLNLSFHFLHKTKHTLSPYFGNRPPVDHAQLRKEYGPPIAEKKLLFFKEVYFYIHFSTVVTMNGNSSFRDLTASLAFGSHQLKSTVLMHSSRDRQIIIIIIIIIIITQYLMSAYIILLTEWWDSNPQSQQANGRKPSL
jgi:hypothetical protein